MTQYPREVTGEPIRSIKTRKKDDLKKDKADRVKKAKEKNKNK